LAYKLLLNNVVESPSYYIKKFSWLGNLLGITLIAYFSASIFTNALALKLTTTPQMSTFRSRGTQGIQTLDEKKDLSYYFVITERNLFNSQSSSLADALASISGPVSESKLKVKLIGTVEGPPEFAFAIVRDESNQQTKVYRIGDKILDIAPVLRIERNRIVILHEGRQEALVIYEEVTGPIAGVATPQVPPPRHPGSSPFSAPDVRMLSPNRYELDKRGFDQQISNIGPLLTQARVVPNLVDGKISGYRIFSIVPDSLYAKIGLREGDIIERVNGAEISTPESALQLFQRFRNESRFQVDLVRDGRKESLSYTIR